MALYALVALSSAAGGVVAIAVGKVTGWLDDGPTVVLQSADTGARASTPSGEPVAEPFAGGSFDPAAIFRDRSSGVVTIYSLFPGHEEGDPEAAAQGAGFVVSAEGYVLTSSHVITTSQGDGLDGTALEAEQVFVEFRNGDRTAAAIVGYDLFNDVGVLKVEPGEHALTPVPLGDSGRVVVGEPVAAIGSPFGQQNSLAVGVVSATERTVNSLTSDYSVVDAIQTDAPINRGNSGGPLFNARGEVIGISAQIRSDSGTAEGVGFAIPINSARRSLEQLIELGRVRYAWAGILAQTISPSLARALGLPTESGAAIQSLVPGSPAERAGLRGGTALERVQGITFRSGGDVIVAIDDVPIRSTEDLVRQVSSSLFPGQRAQFTVWRDGQRIIVSVVLADRPANPDASR